VSVDEIADRLYALAPEEFTQARNDEERELRKAGAREQADQVKALRRPTAAAAAANHLVRAHRARVQSFLEAAARLRDAQVAGKGDLAAAAETERDQLEQLVALGGEAVRPTLQAAAVDDDTARELLEARLVREPEPAGFGTLLAHAEPAAATAPTGRRAAAKPDDGAARARLQDAERTLGEAVAEERQAKRRWTQAQRTLEKAQAAVEKAQRELARLRDQ
jgi:DNA repair exonuclease SbcCD ATPase subunit